MCIDIRATQPLTLPDDGLPGDAVQMHDSDPMSTRIYIHLHHRHDAKCTQCATIVGFMNEMHTAVQRWRSFPNHPICAYNSKPHRMSWMHLGGVEI